MSVNSHTHKKTVEKGLTIYKTGRSRYWQARLWDRLNDKYITRSTCETDRREASIVARNWKDAHLRNASSHLVDIANSDDAFEYYARMIPITAKDDWVILKRSNDGVLAYFGCHNVKFISTGAIRKYLETLNANRQEPLANSTLKKHVIVIRKALRFAQEDGKIVSIPESPKLPESRNRPRPGFEPDDFYRFYEFLNDERNIGNLSTEFVNIVAFTVFTFIRPSENELMGIRVKDVKLKTNDQGEYLEIEIQGKNGYRVAASLPQATSLFKKQIARFDLTDDDFLWYPNTSNRSYAFRRFSRIFTKQLKKSGFQFTADGQKRSAYSLRHFSLTSRLTSSGGKINIFSLAKNAGTSVDMLEKHYIKHLKLNKKIVANLQYMEE